MAEATIEGRGTLGEPETATRRASVNEYRTFSRKLPPALTAAGGVLAILGGLGTWIRVTEIAVGARSPKDVGAAMGYTTTTGWVIAALGILAIAVSWAWFRSNLFLKLVPIMCSLAVAVLVAQRLPSLHRQALSLVAAERTLATTGKRLDFAAFNASFGWGAWCLIAAAVLLVLGTFVGLLRELDLRKGHAE